MSEIREALSADDPDLLFLDEPEWDAAIIGCVERCGMRVVCYDYERCVAVLIARGMDHEEAVDYIGFNITGAYLGEKTPVLFHASIEE